MRLFSKNEELSKSMRKAAQVLSDNVASTLGPRGRNVILYSRAGTPMVTKDGVTVSKFVEMEDEFENVTVQILKQSALMTNLEAGDGTTTSILLSCSIFEAAQKHIAAGVSRVQIKRQLDEAAAEMVDLLKKKARPIQSTDEIESIARISANNDRGIGELVAKAVLSAGKDGGISIKDGRTKETVLDLQEGFRLPAGYVSTSFITDARTRSCSYGNALVLVTDEKISLVDQLMGALKLCSREKKPLVIVADEIEGAALASLIQNALRGTLRVVAVSAPRYGEERRAILEDLAIATGATFFTEMEGRSISEIGLEDFGHVSSFEIFNKTSTYINGAGDSEMVEARIESLRQEIKEEEDLHECEVLQERIGRLVSGVAVINVGGKTEIEMIEKKHRIEDAVEAVKSAQEEGILPGGGVALARLAVYSMQADTNGARVLKDACVAPLKKMAENSGLKPDLMLSKLGEDDQFEMGLNFAESGERVDLYEAGIIDPAKVIRCALQNAVSAAGTLLLSEHAIVEP